VLHAATNAVELGNPGLDTEISNNVDVSLRWAAPGHFAHLSVFYNDFGDYIDLQSTGISLGESPVRRYFQQDAEFVGLELESEFTLVSLAAGSVLLGLNGDLIRGELQDGEDVPRLPPRRLSARLAWSADKLELWARVMDAAEQDRPGLNEEGTEAFTRWDAGLEYRPAFADGGLNVFLNLNNISDEEIRLSTSYLRDLAPEPGRAIVGGLRWRF
jgi:iron complex outermembrane receptor protein